MKQLLTDLSLFLVYLVEKKNLSESSVKAYEDGVSRFLIGNPDLLNLEDYNNFIIKHCIKKRSYHYFHAVKAFVEFKFSSDVSNKSRILEGLIKPKLADSIVMERKYLDEDTIFNVINNLDDPKHKVVALIQTLTGVRAGDILRLKRDNIMPEAYKGKPVLRINILGKGKKRNVIYIHDEVAQEVIMNYISKVYNYNDYYFISLSKMRGRHTNTNSEFRMVKMNYIWFWMDLKQAMQKEGLDFKDFSTHDFRRCFARRCWEKWKDVNVLQGLLHHSNPATTLRYLSQSGLKNIDYHAEMQK